MDQVGKKNDAADLARRKVVAEEIARLEDTARRKTTAMFALPGVYAKFRGENGGKNWIQGPIILRAFEGDDGWDYELLDLCSDGILSPVRSTSNFIELHLADGKELDEKE